MPKEMAQAESAQREQGRALYAKLCSNCHGEKGVPKQSVTALLSPPPSDLTSSVYRYGNSKDDIIATIRRGKGLNMFRFDNRLSPEQIEAIAKFVLTLRTGSVGDSSPSHTSDD